jgi:hypothetical protein
MTASCISPRACTSYFSVPPSRVSSSGSAKTASRTVGGPAECARNQQHLVQTKALCCASHHTEHVHLTSHMLSAHSCSLQTTKTPAAAAQSDGSLTYITKHNARESPPGMGLTRSDTLASASCASRCPMVRPVTALPDLPASGESLAENTMLHDTQHITQHSTAQSRGSVRSFNRQRPAETS